MKKYLVVAYEDADCGLKDQRYIIDAKGYEDAKKWAWDRFSEYHEVGVYELRDTDK